MYAFEISEEAIAFARREPSAQLGLQPLEPGVLAVSPLKDNVVRPDALFAQVRALAPPNGKSRQPAALVLPDYSARIAVLDFDSFPKDKAEQETLVRFRLKKSIPFDLESARISYQVQSGGGKPVEVLVAVTALEIVARYEAAFRAGGFEPGYVTTSTLAALNLISSSGVRVFAKLSGRVLAVTVLADGRLKLMRCVELDALDEREVMAVLYPTFAYVEDQMESAPETLTLCGFGEMSDAVAGQTEQELGVRTTPLRSVLGEPNQSNAGLLGYLESAGVAA